ncbi:uncharacterized protein EDB91DRAFT_1084234 [Suillus paluster]|uniref:uncharacterized protein n=1 Tax=Suillus paluster TaxID=48578 RepID=UPI001B85FB4F|nr:uncharacterized protein EDB91DRAFT_1084234 [Suillus paluster]KAG1734097.1 hypothetical protein EDB91DRAFT_1084234 [Suillus paluster]
MSEQGDVYALRWNNNACVLQFNKEVKYVWERQWSLMTYLYLAVRYFGIFLAMLSALSSGGGLMYMPESLRVYRLQLKLFAHRYPLIVLIQWSYSAYSCLAEGMDIFLYSRPSVFSVKEIVTENFKYCAVSFNIGPMPAIYATIPVISFDIFLAVLAVAIVVKHMKERKEVRMRPNTYVLMIVRYHILYFVLNLTSQIFMAMFWANLPTAVSYLLFLFADSAPYIIAPRLMISIWDTHANDSCVHVSTAFADCVCWAPSLRFDEHEMDGA